MVQVYLIKWTLYVHTSVKFKLTRFVVVFDPSGVTVTGAAPRPAWYGGPAGTSGRNHEPQPLTI